MMSRTGQFIFGVVMVFALFNDSVKLLSASCGLCVSLWLVQSPPGNATAIISAHRLLS